MPRYRQGTNLPPHTRTIPLQPPRRAIRRRLPISHPSLQPKSISRQLVQPSTQSSYSLCGLDSIRRWPCGGTNQLFNPSAYRNSRWYSYHLFPNPVAAQPAPLAPAKANTTSTTNVTKLLVEVPFLCSHGIESMGIPRRRIRSWLWSRHRVENNTGPLL